MIIYAVKPEKTFSVWNTVNTKGDPVTSSNHANVRNVNTLNNGVWKSGSQSQEKLAVDKVFFWYMRCILRVKSTTSTTFVVGEKGQIPTSISCHMIAICYLHGLRSLLRNTLVKAIYMELLKLQCIKNHILRNYKTYKTEFGMEPYLHLIYRNTFIRLRTSSHNLKMERGRYNTPKTPVCDRLCRTCNVTEDQIHFLPNCGEYGSMRDDFYAKVDNRYIGFTSFNGNEKYISLMTSTGPYILIWFGKFIHHIFIKHNEILQNFFG